MLEDRSTADEQPRRFNSAIVARPRRGKWHSALYNGNAPEAIRIRKLVREFTKEVGAEAAADPVIKLAIDRAAELMMIAEVMRGRAIRGERVDLDALIRMQGASSRAVSAIFELRDQRRRQREPEPVESITDYIRKRRDVSRRETETSCASPVEKRKPSPGVGHRPPPRNARSSPAQGKKSKPRAGGRS